MKKLTLCLTLLCAIAATPVLFAARAEESLRHLDVNGNGNYEGAQPNVEYKTGQCVCYCKVTKFEPQEYCTTRCVQEPYTVDRKCCRKVPEYYTKTHCRYVPEYYTTSHCRYRNEYYCVPETKYKTRTIVDTHCRMVPRCYVKRCCVDADVCQPSGGCPTGGCPTGNPGLGY